MRLLAIAVGLLVAPAAFGQITPWTDSQIASAVAKLDEWAATVLDRNYTPGLAIVVVHRDQVIFSKGYGFRNTATREPVQEATVFQLASVSKSLSGSLLAALVGDGLVKLNDRVDPLVPGFQLADDWTTRQVTIRDLFTHQSGLSEHAGDLMEDYGWERQAIIERLQFFQVPSKFRSEYAYTNFGLTAAMEAASRKTKQSFETLAQTRLFNRLGMTTASFRFSDFISRSNRAATHVLADGRWVPGEIRQPDAQAPAGGASGSVLDLAQWMRMEMNGGQLAGVAIVDPDALKLSHLPAIVGNPSFGNMRPSFYSLGFNVNFSADGRRWLRHSGAFGLGTRSEVAMAPDERLGIAVVANSYNGVPEGISQSFFEWASNQSLSRDWLAFANDFFLADEAARIAKYPNYTKPPVPPVPAKALQRYLGSYRNSVYGTVLVTLQGNQLQLQIGPKRRQFLLRHYSGDTFVYQTPGENSVGLGGAIFSFRQPAQAQSLVLDHLNVTDPGAGVFTAF